MIDRGEFLRHFDPAIWRGVAISRQLEVGPYKIVMFRLNGLRFVVWRHAPSFYGDGNQGCAAGSTPIWGEGGAQAAWDALVAIAHADSEVIA